MPRIKAVDDAKTFRAEIIPCLHGAHTLSWVMVQLATKQSAALRAHSGSTREEKHHCWTRILQRELSVGRFLGCICTLSKSVATKSNTSVCADARALCRGGRTPLRYPAVLTIQVIRAIPGKKDELAFFSSDDGDVMIW